MSGPPYPHPNPAPGSNAIGFFDIGASPIGDIPDFDVWTSIISQYANSPILDAMITAFNAAADMTENLDNFYDMVFNVLTAEGYGLDVWGRIVGVSRTLNVPGSGQYFGFGSGGTSPWTGFGGAGFYAGVQITNNVVLTDAQFRPLVLAKAATNIWDGSMPAFNAILLALFKGRGTCYVADGLNMSITLTFQFALTALDAAIVTSSGVLPQPIGVTVNVSSL